MKSSELKLPNLSPTLETINKLVGVDLETTGSSWSDRIIEIGIVTMESGKVTEEYSQRVNPGIPIPPSSTTIHGITDADVEDMPPFEEIASLVLGKIKDATLFGYNVQFDFNVLSNEFSRVNFPSLSQNDFELIDPFAIWKRFDPKTLSHAYEFFCGKNLENAHSALADISATLEVLNAQLNKYNDLPKTSSEISTFCFPKDPTWVGNSYHFIWNDHGEVICNFGKCKGTQLRVLAKEQPYYLDWIINKQFPDDIKDIVKKAKKGVFPKKPEN